MTLKATLATKLKRLSSLIISLAATLAIVGCSSIPDGLGQFHNAGSWFGLGHSKNINTNSKPSFPATQIQNIPFIAQADYHCGPAVLAMMLGQQGIQFTPNEIAKWVYLPGRKGSLQVEMLAAARHPGLLGIMVEPTWQALNDALMANKPIAVLLNLGLDIFPVWHYALVVGYKPETSEVILHNGEKAFDHWPLYTFNRTWNRAKNWGFIIHKPSDPIPGFVSSQSYLDATAALERAHPQKALNAYRLGARAWPNEAWFDFGAGNVLFAKQQFLEAKTYFKRATSTQPTFADAWNNLAETHIALGQKNEARTALNKAIALGGKHLSNYHETARKLN